MDERTLLYGDLQVGTNRVSGGILEATCDGVDILVKDAANRLNYSARDCVPNNTDLNREYATFQFAKLVGPGLVTLPNMALRTHQGKQVLAMEIVKGKHGFGNLPAGVGLTAKRNLALFDAMIGNTDRHSHNYFLISSGWAKYNVVAIDHGLCFPVNTGRPLDAGSTDFLREERLPQWAVKWLDKVLGMETTVRRAISPYLEADAVDGLFTRTNIMKRTGYFMNYRQLRYSFLRTY